MMRFHLLNIIIVIFKFIICANCVIDNKNIVLTKYGPIRGLEYKSWLQNITYIGFKGIPYAKPPTGDLRFQPPEKPDSWTAIRDCFDHGNRCPQIDKLSASYMLQGNEDCLFLNVYTPKLPEVSQQVKYPVMVFIHGGNFEFGSGDDDFYGPDFLVENDVVLVTFNYRLGALGFLGLQNQNFSGNYGLKDQVAVLKWVKDNISKFSGDDENITLFGQNAGAASVHFLMLSKLSQVLFHKAIAQSGCALNPWTMSIKSPKQRAFRLARELGIDTNDTNSLINQLRNVPAANIVNLTSFTLDNNEFLWEGYELPFLPVVEPNYTEALLPESPEHMILKGYIPDIPFMIGFTSQEMLYSISDEIHDTYLLYDIDDMFKIASPRRDYQLDTDSELYERAAALVRKAYFKDDEIREDKLDDFADLLSHVFYVYGIDAAVKMHAQLSKANTFYYRFSYYGWLNKFKLMTDTDLYGASNGDELCYIFRCRNMNDTYHELGHHGDDVKMMMRMSKMWTNFARTGNPTPERISLLDKVKWSPVTTRGIKFLDIDDRLAVALNPEFKHLEFWNDYFQFLQKPTSTDIFYET